MTFAQCSESSNDTSTTSDIASADERMTLCPGTTVAKQWNFLPARPCWAWDSFFALHSSYALPVMCAGRWPFFVVSLPSLDCSRGFPEVQSPDASRSGFGFFLASLRSRRTTMFRERHAQRVQPQSISHRQPKQFEQCTIPVRIPGCLRERQASTVSDRPEACLYDFRNGRNLAIWTRAAIRQYSFPELADPARPRCAQ